MADDATRRLLVHNNPKLILPEYGRRIECRQLLALRARSWRYVCTSFLSGVVGHAAALGRRRPAFCRPRRRKGAEIGENSAERIEV